MNILYICESITNRPVVNVDMLLNYIYQGTLNGLTFTLFNQLMRSWYFGVERGISCYSWSFYTGKLPVMTSFSPSYCQQGDEVLVDDEP